MIREVVLLLSAGTFRADIGVSWRIRSTQTRDCVQREGTRVPGLCGNRVPADFEGSLAETMGRQGETVMRGCWRDHTSLH